MDSSQQRHTNPSTLSLSLGSLDSNNNNNSNNNSGNSNSNPDTKTNQNGNNQADITKPKNGSNCRRRRRLARRRQYNKSHHFRQAIRSQFVRYDDDILFDDSNSNLSSRRNIDPIAPLEFVSEPEAEPESECSSTRLQWSATIVNSPNELVSLSRNNLDSALRSSIGAPISTQGSSNWVTTASNPISKLFSELNSSGSLDSPSSSRTHLSGSSAIGSNSKSKTSQPSTTNTKSNTNFLSSLLSSKKRLDVSIGNSNSNDSQANTNLSKSNPNSPAIQIVTGHSYRQVSPVDNIDQKPLEKTKNLSKSSMRIELPRVSKSLASTVGLISRGSVAESYPSNKSSNVGLDPSRALSLEYPSSSSYVLSDFAILQLVSFLYNGSRSDPIQFNNQPQKLIHKYITCL